MSPCRQWNTGKQQNRRQGQTSRSNIT